MFKRIHIKSLKAGGEDNIHRTPQAIMDEIAALDLESAAVSTKIRELL